MVTAGDFRNGMTVVIDGKVCQILDFMHVKPGKGAAFVRTKYKDIINGGVVENSFNPTAKFDEARIERQEMQYLYNDGDFYNFMDPNTYEQVALPMGEFTDAMKFVKENENCKLVSYQGKTFSVEPPISVELEVTETDPGFAGNTATNALKPATVETGAEVKVPLFIEIGEIIKIDTRTGEYTGRGGKN
ncbi:MAG: elongation factor P [Lachnospiraceae bacterium]|nr:elongation factor P [Lachnospiraceae bacterium]